MQELPTRIGKYEIEAELGAGGFGRVLRAFDPTVPRRVAIKVMTTQGDRELLARFRNEAAAAGNLQHKNIVTIFESGDYDSIPFIAMEFLEGEDLQRVIENHRPLSVLDKVSIMSEVAEGLSYAHQHRVVHRDVKPANIMLLSDGRVKIMDFGIARVARENATRLTTQGDVIGTLRYMSPEQFAGATETGILADIFAYGVVFYELLTGRHPFASKEDDLAVFIGRLSTQDPPPLRDLAPECPEALEEVLRRALQKEPELRYQTLDDLAVDVKPILFELRRSRAQALVLETQEGLSAGSLDTETAQGNLRRILELDPSNREALKLRPAIQASSVRPRVESLLKNAEKEIASRRFPEAIQLYESALRLDKQNLQIRQLLDEAREQHEQRKGAARLLAQANQQFQQQDLTNAYRNAEEALQADPENERAAELLNSIRRDMDRRENQRKFYDGLAKARNLLLLQDFDQALRILNDLQNNPEKTPQLEELFESVRQQQAEQARYHRLRDGTIAARALLKESRFEEGVSQLEALAAEFPGAKEVADLLAYAREEIRQRQASEEAKQVAAEAQVLLDGNHFEEAIAFLSRAVQSFPGDAELVGLQQQAWARQHAAGQEALADMLARCPALFEANRLAEALLLVNTGLREHGRDPALLEWQTRIQKEWDRQEQQEAVQKLADEARGLLDAGRPEEALLLLERACAQYAGETALMSLREAARGQTSCARGREDAQKLVGESRFFQATEILKRLAQSYPADPTVKKDLRDATILHLQQLQERGLARDVLDGATELLSLYPKDPQGRQLQVWATENVEGIRPQEPPPAVTQSEPATAAVEEASRELEVDLPAVPAPTEAAAYRRPKPSMLPFILAGVAVVLVLIVVAVLASRRQDRAEQQRRALLEQMQKNTPQTSAASDQPRQDEAKQDQAKSDQPRQDRPKKDTTGQDQTQTSVRTEVPESSGKIKATVPEFDPASASWKENRRKLIETATSALQQKRFDAVIRAAQSVLDHDPNDKEAVRLLAAARSAQSANACPPALAAGAAGTNYFGDVSRPFSWVGTLNPDCSLEIRGSTASAGRLDPRGNKDLKAIPGLRATVKVLSPSGIEVRSQPSEQNGFTLKLHNGTGKPVTEIRLNWHDDTNN